MTDRGTLTTRSQVGRHASKRPAAWPDGSRQQPGATPSVRTGQRDPRSLTSAYGSEGRPTASRVCSLDCNLPGMRRRRARPGPKGCPHPRLTVVSQTERTVPDSDIQDGQLVDLDLRIRTLPHWPDTFHWSTDQVVPHLRRSRFPRRAARPRRIQAVRGIRRRCPQCRPGRRLRRPASAENVCSS
jgi:hypothetical protein